MAQEKATPAAAPEAKDFDPSRLASARLLNHILQKGFQSGGVLGVGAIAPAGDWAKRTACKHNRGSDTRLKPWSCLVTALTNAACVRVCGCACALPLSPAVALYNKSLDPRLLTKTLGYSALGFTALAGERVAKLGGGGAGCGDMVAGHHAIPAVEMPWPKAWASRCAPSFSGAVCCARRCCTGAVFGGPVAWTSAPWERCCM